MAITRQTTTSPSSLILLASFLSAITTKSVNQVLHIFDVYSAFLLTSTSMVQIRLLVSLTYSLQSDLDLFLDLGHQLVLFQWQAGELEIHGRGIFHTGNNSHQLGIVEITTEIVQNGGEVLHKSPILNDKAQAQVRRVNTSEDNRERLSGCRWCIRWRRRRGPIDKELSSDRVPQPVG